MSELKPDRPEELTEDEQYERLEQFTNDPLYGLILYSTDVVDKHVADISSMVVRSLHPQRSDGFETPNAVG